MLKLFGKIKTKKKKKSSLSKQKTLKPFGVFKDQEWTGGWSQQLMVASERDLPYQVYNSSGESVEDPSELSDILQHDLFENESGCESSFEESTMEQHQKDFNAKSTVEFGRIEDKAAMKNIVSGAVVVDSMINDDIYHLKNYMRDARLCGMVRHIARLGYDEEIVTQSIRDVICSWKTSTLVRADPSAFFGLFIKIFENISTLILKESCGHSFGMGRRMFCNQSELNFGSFPWPVFEMAQFEYGETTKASLCGEYTCVLVNLPKLPIHEVPLLESFFMDFVFDREHMPVTCNIPTEGNNNFSKGVAFLEFNTHRAAKEALGVINGLHWAPHVDCIRGKMFREYAGANFFSPEECGDGSLVDDMHVQSNNETITDAAPSLELKLEKRIESASFDASESSVSFTEEHIIDDFDINQDDHLSSLEQQLKYLEADNSRQEERIKFLMEEHRRLMFENKDLKRINIITQQEILQSQELATSLSRKVHTRENQVHDLECKLKRSDVIILNLRRRMMVLTGQGVSDLNLTELKDVEGTLEQALLKIREEKENKLTRLQLQLDRQVERHNEMKLCVVCLSAEKTILCFPCRHLCMCENCSQHDQMVKCPVCREEIAELIPVYA